MDNKLTLPEGWQWKKLGEVIELSYGKALKNENRTGGAVCVYGSNGVVGYHDEALINFDTVVIGRKGSVGEVNLALGKSWVIDTAYFVEIINPQKLNLLYFFNFAKTLDVSKISQKGVKPGVNRSNYLNFFIPLPPPPTQQKIVAKIQAAFTRLDEAITHQKQNLQRAENLKKAVLEEVFAAGKWEEKKLGEVAFVTKLAGFEYTKHFNLTTEGEVPVIRAQNVRMNYISEKNLLFLPLAVSKILERSALIKPSVLMTFIGAGIGDVAVFNKSTRWHLAPNVAKVEPEKQVNVHFLQYFLMSPNGRKEIFKSSKTTAQPNLSMKTIREIITPLPPLPEQQQIVAYLDRAFAKADELIAAQKARLARLEALKKSILEEAFRGALVQ